ncbi:hypothetical protein [Endozoicomonas arenosclerae]|uniref:hypothetical protein n=1 Tax=Endozoicomonas arenosclerae TaxID=1633495 RepID=UPI000781AC29|nr:hypothetical protein [Endozoicomonas arenosclerae]
MKNRLIMMVMTTVLGSASAWASQTSTTTAMGDVYTDYSGKTLYTFAKDSEGKSVCEGDCAVKWPPFLASGDSSDYFANTPGFSKIKRNDGSQQWAKDGMPLYRWFKDENKGDITGAGVKGAWPVARVDDVTLKLYNNGQSRFLVDADNMTLYTFDKDQQNQSNCYGDCAVKWPPAYVDANLTKDGINNIKLSGGFDIIKRNDGTYQWSYQGQPLYHWFKDQAPGETSGDGVKNVWHLVSK